MSIFLVFCLGSIQLNELLCDLALEDAESASQGIHLRRGNHILRVRDFSCFSSGDVHADTHPTINAMNMLAHNWLDAIHIMLCTTLLM